LIGYFLGVKLGHNGLKKFGVDSNGSMYKSSCSFFKKYGSLSIVLGREFNITRAFVPFFAGCFKMSKYKFAFVAFVSNVIWSVLSVLLGYYFGYIIVNNFDMLFFFMLFLSLYIFLLVFTYKSFIAFSNANKELIHKFSLHNMIFAWILVLCFILLLFIKRWNMHILFNDYFAFFLFPELFYLGFLLSRTMLFLFISFFFFVFIVTRKYRLALVFFWSLVFSLFYALILNFLLIKFFGLIMYYSVLVFCILIFYIWIFMKSYNITLKKYYFINTVFVLLLLFFIFIKFSITSNMYVLLLSFIFSAIFCEFLLILSNYQVLDKVLSSTRWSDEL